MVATESFPLHIYFCELWCHLLLVHLHPRCMQVTARVFLNLMILWNRRLYSLMWINMNLYRVQRKVLKFYSLPLVWAYSMHYPTQERAFQLAPNTFWWAALITQFLGCNLNSSKNCTCTSVKLRMKFSSPIAKSTSPGLLDTTVFLHAACTVLACSWRA